LITRDCPESIIQNVLAHEFPNSDHHLVTFDMCMKKPAIHTKTVQYRKYRSIDIDQFKQDISKSDLYKHPSKSLEGLVCQYNSVLKELLDKHAPLVDKKIVIRPDNQWYTEETRTGKIKRRACERKWRKSKLEVDRLEYKQQCIKVNTMLTEAKTKYYSEMVTNSTGQKELFKIVDKLMHRKTVSPLPKHETPLELANRFSEYFDEKIRTLRTSLESYDADAESPPSPIENETCLQKLASFEPTTEDEVRKIIMHAATKTCSLDPIPTWLLKDSLDALLPVIISIINNPSCLVKCHLT
jgi:DNA-directed RNA polymerase subunit F